MRIQTTEVVRLLLADGKWYDGVEGARISDEVTVAGRDGERTFRIPMLACTVGGVCTFVPLERVAALQYRRPTADAGIRSQ